MIQGKKIEILSAALFWNDSIFLHYIIITSYV